MNNYQIFTDSTADLIKTLPEYSNIDVITLPLTLNNETVDYVKNDNFDIYKFYDDLRSGVAYNTSQNIPMLYTSIFQKVLNTGKDVIYIAFSSALSSTYNSANLSALELREQYPERKILIIDSLCAAAGQGLLLHTAAKKQIEGFTIEQLFNWVEKEKNNVCHWFSVKDLMYLKRSGRLSATEAFLGTAFKINPILHMDVTGNLVPVNKVRGRKHSIQKIVEAFEDGWDGNKDNYVFLAHGCCDEDAKYLHSLMSQKYPDINFQLTPIGPIVGSHAGPDVILICYFGNNK